MDKLILTGLLIIISTIARGQDETKRTVFGEDHAKKELNKTLKDRKLTGEHVKNLVDGKTEIIKDKETLTQLAETVLFGLFDRDNIKSQRPYEIYKIGKYWTINGTLPTEVTGGTFFIIVDSTTGQILRITHDE